MPLAAISINNLRSFGESGRVDLADLNVFIGANSAGKSTLLKAIELAYDRGGREEPLALSNHTDFNSFRSVLRQQWSSKAKRASHFDLTYEWLIPTRSKKRAAAAGDAESIWVRYSLSGQSRDGTTYVSGAVYGRGPLDSETQPPFLRLGRTESAKEFSTTYRFRTRKQEEAGTARFFGQTPVLTRAPEGGKADTELVHGRFVIPPPFNQRLSFMDDEGHLVVVRPYRPIPRSFYVMNDPGMTLEDRSTLTILMRIWSDKSPAGKSRQDQIRADLRTLKLAQAFSVHENKGTRGPRVVELRVTTERARHEDTLADVGFGVSQVLPMLAHNAMAKRQPIVVYQPEVHLHPKAQSRLADIFVDSVTKRGNRLFVETHSEALVLRLQYLVANKNISPERVRVFCVEKQDGESTVRRFEFDERGVPKSPWPAGFLDTSFALSRELMGARMNQGATATKVDADDE